MRQMLRVRWLRELAIVMAIETETAAAWTAQPATVTSTRNELKQRCWLEKVSICVKVEECKTATYLCHPGHPSDLQSVCTEALGLNVNMEESNPNL